LNVPGGTARRQRLNNGLDKALLAVVRELLQCRKLLADAVRLAEAAGKDPPAGYREQVIKVDAHLETMSGDSAEYAAMTRAARE
jgi:hypothetical protein